MSLSRNGTPSLLISPNSVLANALLRSIDILRPRVLAARPTRVEFVVSTPRTTSPTSIWPPSTATWSRNARSAATHARCT